MVSNRGERERGRPPSLLEEDVGKRVITADGDVIGDIDHVGGGEVYINPNPRVLDGIGSFISRAWRPDQRYSLDCQHIARVDDDTVVLKSSGECPEYVSLKR